MYKRTFRKADQTHRFLITNTEGAGWEVREEQDSQVIWRVRYTDWHRVERARMAFANQALNLQQSGWQGRVLKTQHTDSNPQTQLRIIQGSLVLILSFES